MMLFLNFGMLSRVEARVLCSLMSIVKGMRGVQAQSARVL